MELRTSGFLLLVGNGSGYEGAKNWLRLHITVVPQLNPKEGKFTNCRVE
jgi:hypothetical protein